MNCSYCSSRYLIREKEPKTLTFDQLKQAVDVISQQSREKYIQDKFNGRVKIYFTGGEPLLEFELLKKTISYIRTKKTDFGIFIITNGTLLTETMMDFFVRNNVEVCLGFNGEKIVNDLHRKFGGNKSKSVFEVVMGNLKKGLLNEKYKGQFDIGTTLTSQTIGSLSDVVKFFRHNVGFRKLEIGLEAYEIWSRAGINRLRNALRSLVSGFLATLKHETDIKGIEAAFCEFPFSQYIRSHCEEADYETSPVALFYDGYFYLSPDFVVKPPLERKYRVGDLKHGVDFKRIEAMASSPIFTEISRKCLQSRCKSGPLSPVERYYWGIVHEFTPDRLRQLLENTSRVNRVFNEEMDRYIKLHRIYDRRVVSPSFGDFEHSPKYRSSKEVKSFHLTIRNASDIAGLRKSIDYFLYSPGSVKKLVLDVLDGTQTAHDVMEGMVLYVLMKTGYLKKRIWVTVACRAGDTSAFGPTRRGDADRRRYLSENGVRAGTCFAGE